MTEADARRLLGDAIRADGHLDGLDSETLGHRYVSWAVGEADACLDASFTAEELEAIAWWMRYCEKLKENGTVAPV